MNVAIVTNLDFNNQNGASYSRISNYIHSLTSYDHQYHIYSNQYSYRGTKKNILNKKDHVLIQGKAISKIKSIFDDFLFLENTILLKAIIKNSAKEKNDAILLYYSSFSIIITALIYARLIKRRKVIVEKNELKTAIALNRPVLSGSIKQVIINSLVKSITLIPSFLADAMAPLFSGLIVISTRFEKLYSPFTNKIIRIPILSRINKTAPQDVIKKTCFKIGYFGLVSEKKDGVFSLIEAVERIQKDVPVILELYGTGNKDAIKKVQAICKRDNRILYHGNTDFESAQKKMHEFQLLAFPRPKNLQTVFGFSTKLSEYLSTGVPVLTSDIGDNNVFLKDMNNSFLIPNQRKLDIHILYDKIEQIIKTYNTDIKKYSEIGQEGYKTAKQYFNPEKYSELLNSFIASKNTI